MVANSSRNDVRDDWNASWIWVEGESHPKNFHVYARKAFKLPAEPVQALLRITADSRYKLYVNGNYVGWGAANSFTRRLTYDTYDIAQFLTKGQNVIAVHVYHLGHPANNYVPRRAALICEADIELKNGSEQIVTDETWRVLPAQAWTAAGTRVSRNLGYQQVYDAGLEPDGWTEAKFKDAKWPTAVVIGQPPTPPFGRLSRRELPRAVDQIVWPVEIVSANECPGFPEEITPPEMPRFIASEEYRPLGEGKVEKPERLLDETDSMTTVKLPEGDGVAIILDFGRQVYGSLELALSRCTSGIIDIAYDETLPDEGLRPDRGGIFYTDRIILKKGKYTWSSFEPRAFRYVQLDFRECPKPIAINSVFVRDASFPIEPVGSFESDNSSLNEIWQAGIESVRRSLMDTYIDTPWRDRSPSLADIIAAIKPGYFAFGEVPLIEERLRHIAASQRRDGALLGLHPGTENRVFVDLAMLWVMAAWDNFVCGGDRELLADIYPTVDRWQQWIGRFVDNSGLLEDVRADLFLDWGKVNRHGEMAGLSCLYLGSLVAMRGMAEALGRTADAAEFARDASVLRSAIHKNFWSPNRGLYSDVRMYGKLDEHYSRQTNILAVAFDVPDHYQKSSILRQMLDDRGLPPVSSPFLTTMLVETLCRNQMIDQAMEYVERNQTKGGKAAASQMATYHLQAYVLGVVPAAGPGRIRVEPHISELRWAHGSVPTHAGPVKIDWKVGVRGFSLNVDIPDGLSAELVPPSHSPLSRVQVDGRQTEDLAVEIGPGSHTLLISRDGKRRTSPKIEVKQVEAERAPVPPGRGDIETVEQMIRILTQMEKDQVYVVDRSGMDEESEESKPRPRGRGRRSRGKGEEIPAQVVETPEDTEEIDQELAELHAEIGDLSGNPLRERRPRRRGYRRGDRRGDRTEEGEPTAVVAADQPEAPAAAEEPSTEAPAKRSRRRRRRGKGQGTEVIAEPTGTTTEPEPEPTAPVVEDAQAPDQPEKRSRRRRRGRGRGSEVGTEIDTETVDTVTETSPEPAPVADETEASDQPEKRSRRRRRRRRGGDRPEMGQESTGAEAETRVEVEATPPPAEEAPAAEKRPRSRGRRGPRTPEETPTIQPEPAAEPQVASEEEPDRRPRRRRRRPSGDQLAEPQPVESAPAPEPQPDAVDTSAAPKRRRRSSTAKSEAREEQPPAVEAAPAAEEPTEKPKRRRTRSRKTGADEPTPAEPTSES